MDKTYLVRLPVAGIISFEVKAGSGEEAIVNALLSDILINLTEGTTNNSATLEEWDIYKKTAEGNVNYTPLWKAEYEEIDN